MRKRFVQNAKAHLALVPPRDKHKRLFPSGRGHPSRSVSEMSAHPHVARPAAKTAALPRDSTDLPDQCAGCMPLLPTPIPRGFPWPTEPFGPIGNVSDGGRGGV